MWSFQTMERRIRFWSETIVHFFSWLQPGKIRSDCGRRSNRLEWVSLWMDSRRPTLAKSGSLCRTHVVHWRHHWLEGGRSEIRSPKRENGRARDQGRCCADVMVSSKWNEMQAWGCLIIDPRGRPQSRLLVITIFTHVVHPYVRMSVPKMQYQAEITASRNCGLAEWINDDSCLVWFESKFN